MAPLAQWLSQGCVTAIIALVLPLEVSGEVEAQLPTHWTTGCGKEKADTAWPCRLSYVAKRVQIVGGDAGAGLAAAKQFRSGCAHVFIVGREEANTLAAFEELSNHEPEQGVCPPGLTALLGWAAGDIRDQTFTWKTTLTLREALKGPPEFSWNFERGEL